MSNSLLFFSSSSSFFLPSFGRKNRISLCDVLDDEKERWGRLANNPNSTNYSTHTSHTHLWFGFTSSIFCRIRFFVCIFCTNYYSFAFFGLAFGDPHVCVVYNSHFLLLAPTERRTYYDELMITFSFVSADGAANIYIHFLWRERYGDTERISGCWIMCFMVRRAFDLMASLSSYFSLCTHLTFTFRFVRVSYYFLFVCFFLIRANSRYICWRPV